MTHAPRTLRRLAVAAGMLAAAAAITTALPAPGALAAPGAAGRPGTASAASGSLPGCTRASTATFIRSGMLQNPASPRTAGWFTSGTWGSGVQVTGGLCLESVRMYVHDSVNALRTWEVTADGKTIASVSVRTGPGYHYWTFTPDQKLGKVTSLCIGVTVPEAPKHPGALAAQSCYSIGWLA